MADFDTLELTLSHARGSTLSTSGTDYHPLGAALQSLLGEGRPMKDFRNILISRDNSWLKPVHWLGVLVHTQGGRISFFPGFRATGLDTLADGEPHARKAFPVDHITIERGLGRFHLTTPGSKDHLGNYKTHPVGDGVFAFSLHVREPNVLTPLTRETHFKFTVPSSDSRRRGKLLKSVRNGAEDVLLSLSPGSAVEHTTPAFLYVEVYAGPQGFDVPFGPARALPPLMACADVSPKPVTPMHWSQHRTSVRDGLDVVFSIGLAPGRLRGPFGIGAV